jgi:hypothetical protein
MSNVDKLLEKYEKLDKLLSDEKYDEAIKMMDVSTDFAEIKLFLIYSVLYKSKNTQLDKKIDELNTKYNIWLNQI